MSPTTTCTVISNVITLIDPFDVAYIPSSSEILSFSVEGMTMPASLKPHSALIITTMIKNSTTFYSVDTVSSTGLFVSTVGSMTEATATPSNTLAYITTTYTFKFRPQHAVLQGGYVTVALPSQVSIPDTATAASSCRSVSGFNAGMV